MKTKYIIQIKRGLLWEDVLTYHNKENALRDLYMLRLRNPRLHIRCLEVFVIC